MDHAFETTLSELANENVLRATSPNTSTRGSHDARASRDPASENSRSPCRYVVRARFSGDAVRLVTPDERSLFLDECNGWSITGKPRRFETRDAAESFVRAHWPQFWDRPDGSVVIDVLNVSDVVHPLL